MDVKRAVPPLDDDDLVSRLTERALEVASGAIVQIAAGVMNDLRQRIKNELRAEFQGDRAYIRKTDGQRKSSRDAAIRHDRKPKDQGGGGLSIRALARKWHLSKSQIERILAARDGQ